ncbi:hypothetical protein [Amycolatopsis sp. CA-128772]|uniref:hypothetical protein n=1 Tax=Amycolatopsis sp. CA-128772 TaxID=2073159 RepID=UPI000CD29D55|nr:hypothetical protein [Amycolatopsis sp. CA-128772]
MSRTAEQPHEPAQPAGEPAATVPAGPLAGETLREYVARAVDGWPPFTQDQREQLAALLSAPALVRR